MWKDKKREHGYQIFIFESGPVLMEGTAKERWTELCERPTNEQNPAKLLVLVKEINRLLDEKKCRLDGST
jgi:hypothetical protein